MSELRELIDALELARKECDELRGKVNGLLQNELYKDDKIGKLEAERGALKDTLIHIQHIAKMAQRHDASIAGDDLKWLLEKLREAIAKEAQDGKE
jgi:hypothetical protein